jgi:hypothetical protein
MKNSKIIFTTIITLSIYVVSCSKKDTEKPSITINKPISTDTFSVYNDIKLDIDMSDNTDLHESTVVVTDSMGNNIFTDNPYVHEQNNFKFQKNFKIASIDYLKKYTLTVTASDHSDNIQSQSVSFWVKP